MMIGYNDITIPLLDYMYTIISLEYNLTKAQQINTIVAVLSGISL